MELFMFEAERLLATGHRKEASVYYGKAGAYYRSVLEKEPDNLAARETLARCLFGSQDYDGCEREIGRILEERPESAIAHYLLGGLHFSSHRFQESEAECRKAIAADPTLSRAYLALNASLVAQRKYQEARDILLQALQLTPDNSDLHLSLSVVCGGLGQRGEALREARLAFKLHPSRRTWAELVYALGRHLWLPVIMSIFSLGCLLVRSPYTVPVMVVAEGYLFADGIALVLRRQRQQGIVSLALDAIVLTGYVLVQLGALRLW
jgi:tetratricopeptide (TPR) repeat protein